MEFLVFTVLFILLILMSDNSNKEHFDVTNTSKKSWKDLASLQCQTLKNEALELNGMLDSCLKGNNVALGQRNNINSKINCIDTNNRLIFNKIESDAWCNQSNGLPTVSTPINPSNITFDNTPALEDIFISDVKNYTRQPNFAKENNKLYKKIQSDGFMGHDVSQKQFASW